MVAVGVIALVARLVALTTSNDIFIDEITYTNIARNLAHGGGVTLYGQPFFLHPPAVFGLFALVIGAFGIHGSTESVIFSLRHVDVVVGSCVCVLTYLLVERVGLRWVAVVAALLVAIDPLVITYDSRVMLEAPTQLAVVSAFLFLALGAGAPGPLSSRGRWLGSARGRWLIAAGVAAGTVFCMKETFGLVVGLALALLVITGWIVSRQEAGVVLGIGLICYAVSVVAMGLSYGFGGWWHDQVGGVSRLVGTTQISGFNSPQVHVSIVSRLLADLSTLALSYLVLGFGTLAALSLLLRLSPWRWRHAPEDTRTQITILVAIWAVSAAAYLVYATLLGTIEEQMYYILLLPAAISLCLWLADNRGPRFRQWQRVGAVLLTVVLLFDAAVWIGVHSRQDDEYRQMHSWEAVHIPPTAVVSATDGVSQFLLSRGIIGQWSTLPELKAHHVDFVVVNVSLVDQGYGLADSSFERLLQRRGRLVFEANGATDVSLRIYNVQPITGSYR
jgi:4-amino-4-deoxy-L-arabinose transferase-like glycosyltransferase